MKKVGSIERRAPQQQSARATYTTSLLHTRHFFRVVAFAFLTPFFFLKGGMNISVPAVIANLGLVALLLGAKLLPKFVGVYPVARRYVPRDAIYTTLLMSTGLTFGTISALYGLNAGIIDQTQFSVLVTVVVLTAILPTIVAQRWFTPPEAEGR